MSFGRTACVVALAVALLATPMLGGCASTSRVNDSIASNVTKRLEQRLNHDMRPAPGDTSWIATVTVVGVQPGSSSGSTVFAYYRAEVRRAADGSFQKVDVLQGPLVARVLDPNAAGSPVSLMQVAGLTSSEATSVFGGFSDAAKRKSGDVDQRALEAAIVAKLGQLYPAAAK